MARIAWDMSLEMLEQASQDVRSIRTVLIRVLASRSHYRKWLEPNLVPRERMRDTFGYDHSPVSVYSVATGIDEAKAVAAHYLTLKRSSLETLWTLRIEPYEAENLDITIQKTPGDTGIAEVDAKHCDLLGNAEQFEILTERLYNAIRCGEDRLRVLEKTPLEYHLQAFLRLDSGMASDSAKHYCQQVLRI